MPTFLSEPPQMGRESTSEVVLFREGICRQSGAVAAITYNFSIEEVRLGLDMKLARMGHTKRISHSG